ncbi:hypothetical protein [Metabacillus idriensis]|uniref:hypothetical protein n=1 Tax=Metabacillus idriensis TaxID=324768 RepID=UPI003D29B0CA
MSIISLKILIDNNTLKYVKVVRKITGDGISEIKSHILSGDPVFQCELLKDEDGTKKLLKLIQEINKIGGSIILVKKEKDGRLENVSIEYLENRVERFKDIQQENERLDDLRI